jgi:hypothetical protein
MRVTAKEVILAGVVIVIFTAAYASFNQSQLQPSVYGAGAVRLAPVNGTWKLVKSTALNARP